MNAPRKLVIEESKWYRGLGPNSRLLVPEDGRMCCLGFDSLECGFTKDAIFNVTFPSHLSPASEKQAWLRDAVPSGVAIGKHYSPVENDEEDDRPSFQNVIASTNDDQKITDDERKKLLTELFLTGGNIELVFVP